MLMHSAGYTAESISGANDITGAYMVTVYLPKDAAIETGKLLGPIIARNMKPNTWSIFRSEDEGKGKLLTIVVDDRSLKAIKCRSCLSITYLVVYLCIRIGSN